MLIPNLQYGFKGKCLNPNRNLMTDLGLRNCIISHQVTVENSLAHAAETFSPPGHNYDV